MSVTFGNYKNNHNYYPVALLVVCVHIKVMVYINVPMILLCKWHTFCFGNVIITTSIF